jgi:transducin (beta)-like 1
LSFVPLFLFSQIETHLNTDGTCTEPFDLLKNHVCSVKRDAGPGAALVASGASNLDAQESLRTAGGAVPATHTLKLSGHSGDVVVGAWSPRSATQLATGSHDASARVWQIQRPDTDNNKQPSKLADATFTSTELLKKAGDVTTLDWHPNGRLLVTGSAGDGCVRLWSVTGELVRELSEHKGPIFRAKFNRSGDYLLSGSVDKSMIVWDANSGAVKHRYSVHDAAVLDVDWRDETTFASCAQDKTIFVCEVGKNEPIARFAGHSDEVNIVRWSPSGELLASCSDDLTAKIWKLGQPNPVHDLRSHTKEIYSLKWSPTGPGSDNPNQDLLLASGGADSSVKLWDPNTGKERFNLTRHSEPVYSVAFSPDGQFLASGSFDKTVCVWSAKDGSLVRTFTGNAGIYEVCWNTDGSMLAACCTNSDVHLIDIRT